MTEIFFITGTDTDVGKTFVSIDMINDYHKKNMKTFGIKLIASGCQKNSDGKLVNDDALALQKSASIKRPYEIVNPFAFEPPIAPHIAGDPLDKNKVKEKLMSSIQHDADINIIEGAGGWMVPLNDQDYISDVIVDLGIPVILVVGMKLGCINHAILSAQSIRASGASLLGWVANCIDPDMLALEENIETLRQRLWVPCLKIVPHVHFALVPESDHHEFFSNQAKDANF